MTKKNSYCLMRLFLLFALFVTVPKNSYIYIPSYGLFGELKTLAVADEYYSNYPTKIEKTVQGAGRMAENHLPALFRGHRWERLPAQKTNLCSMHIIYYKYIIT